MQQSSGTSPQSILSRTKILQGRYIYSINHNYDYSLANLPVYEDGIVDCWGGVDLAMLKEKINEGSLSPVVPNRQRISIFHLGMWEIETGEWLFTKDNYYDFIVSVVRSMNPQLENLYVANGRTTKKIGNTNYAAFAYGEKKMVRQDDNLWKEYKGKRTNYFYKLEENCYCLCSLDIYADSKILIDGLDNPQLVSRETVKDLVDVNTLVTRIPDGATVLIRDLGLIKIAKTVFNIDVYQKLAEIDDIIAELNKQPSTSDICSQCYYDYTSSPTSDNKERLKAAYEKVPTHLRVYILGDMDSKDARIREIIYGRL